MVIAGANPAPRLSKGIASRAGEMIISPATQVSG